MFVSDFESALTLAAQYVKQTGDSYAILNICGRWCTVPAKPHHNTKSQQCYRIVDPGDKETT